MWGSESRQLNADRATAMSTPVIKTPNDHPRNLENSPFPVSIAKNASGAWYFDTESGKQEVLYRRVGTNENDGIEICYALVGAQREYASPVRNGEKWDRNFTTVAPGRLLFPMISLICLGSTLPIESPRAY